MESQPQNPDFKINPENSHPCIYHVMFIISNLMLQLQETIRI